MIETAGTITPRVAAIRALVKAGYALFPLNGKIPAIRGWRDVTPGQYNETNLPGNYGVVLRAGDVVVDVDPRNFAPGDHPLKRLVADVGAPLDSFTVRTGGKPYGLHTYFKKNPDILFATKLKAYPGIDFKREGGFVVGPGSIHPDTGNAYEVALGSPEAVADAPFGLETILKRTQQQIWSETAGTGEYKDDEATRGRYVDYLRNHAPTSGTYGVACRGRDFGLPPQTTWNLMVEYWLPRRVDPRTPEEAKARVIHAYQYAQSPIGSAHPAADFKDAQVPTPAEPNLSAKAKKIEAWDTTDAGTLRKSFFNLLNYLNSPDHGLYKVFGFNEFTGRIEFTGPAPWHEGKRPGFNGVGDMDLMLLKGHLATKCGFEMTVGVIVEAVSNVAHHNRFHPVREYLESLKWDGAPRVDTWLHDFLGVEDSVYTRAVARKVLCAAVMRVMKPGIKFDHVLVLEGAQDIGKSSVCEILGGPWAADFAIDPHNKDTVQLLQGKWVVELAEMEVQRRADIDALKAFLTRRKDEARLAYGRVVGEFPRQSIFIATKNPYGDGTYLDDPTGNRRWWPVFCRPVGGQVDFKKLREIRNQLFAEAFHICRTTGEPLSMHTHELKQVAKEVVGARHADHAWTERIASWLAEQDARPETRKDFLTARDVFIDAMGGTDQKLDRRACQSIAGVMRTLGWESGFKRDVSGRLVRGYWRIFPDGGFKLDKKTLDILGPLF